MSLIRVLSCQYSLEKGIVHAAGLNVKNKSMDSLVLHTKNSILRERLKNMSVSVSLQALAKQRRAMPRRYRIQSHPLLRPHPIPPNHMNDPKKKSRKPSTNSGISVIFQRLRSRWFIRMALVKGMGKLVLLLGLVSGGKMEMSGMSIADRFSFHSLSYDSFPWIVTYQNDVLAIKPTIVQN